ncbi:MAG: hypothetical protein U0Z26_01895 [Anaerolineales bacterium]
MQLQFSTIEVPILLLWVIGFVVFFGGAFLGYLNKNVDANKKMEATQAKADMLLAEAEKKLEEAKSLKMELPAMVDDPGLLRLKISNQVPTLEMDGAVLNVKEISPDKKKRLIELISILRPWIESGQPVQPTTPKPAAVVTPPPAQPQPASPYELVSALRQDPPTKPLPPVTAKSIVDEKVLRSLSIIAQIDMVLQAQIADTSLAGRGISIYEGPASGIEVAVGLEKYLSIDEVPDPEIRNAIRVAIAEWERKYVPGT